MMQSNVNQELKNSMFQGVYDYDIIHMPDKRQQKMEEEKMTGRLPMQSISTPYVAAGYDQNPLISGYAQDSALNLPEVVLEQVPGTMRASEN